MIVLIAGGGRTGAQLASLLVAQNHNVRLVEHRREVLYQIHRDLPTEVIFEGDATQPSVLELAGIQQAQVLAACTPSDADNLVLSFFARSRYKVPRTIARVNNPANAWLFNETFHVDVALNAAEVMASLIEEEMSLGDMMTLLKLRRGEYSLVEEKVAPTAPVVGKTVREVAFPEACTLVAILRKGELLVPHGDTVLEPVDEILALVHASALSDLAAMLGPTR